MSLAQYYKRMLVDKEAPGGEAEGAKSLKVDLSDDAKIKKRCEDTKRELYRIVKDFLGDKPELYSLVDKIAEQGQVGLRAVGQEDEEALADGKILAFVEVIVRTDGSRPSFMVQDGMPNPMTSPDPAGWTNTLKDQAGMLRQAIQCVGRIDDPDPDARQGFQGTGTLVGENVVITNRHVLQAIATLEDDKWHLKPGIAIDFGHEFRSRDSIGRRKITNVLFAGAQPIVRPIDHSKLDLAVLELEPATGASEPQQPVALELATDWGQKETGIFVCGYPGAPHPDDYMKDDLTRLFNQTFGFKRLAPGYVTRNAKDSYFSPRHWSLSHDATTIAGNSGSSVFVIGRERVTAGVHYGGILSAPRENWCHVIGLTLDETDGKSKKTLGELLKERGVVIEDSFKVKTPVPKG